MSKFNVTVSAKVEAYSADYARQRLESAINRGTAERLFDSAVVTDVAEVDEITISRADLDAMIAQCVADALAQAQSV